MANGLCSEAVFDAYEALSHAVKMKFRAMVLYCGVKEDNEAFIEDHSDFVFFDTYSINDLAVKINESFTKINH